MKKEIKLKKHYVCLLDKAGIGTTDSTTNSWIEEVLKFFEAHKGHKKISSS